MNRETALAGGAALLLAVALLGAAVVPGALADPGDEPLRPGYVEIRETSIAPGAVTGSTATLEVETRLSHDGNPSENVTVLLRAIDAESGMRVATREIRVETLRGDRETAVVGNVTVPREGGYRIESIVFRDGARVDTGGKQVEGVGTLKPAYATTPVEFHQYGGGGAELPVIEYSVANVENNRSTLSVAAHLTNTGDAPAGDLRVVFKARQSDSNVVAAERSVDVGRIRPGRTASPTASITVPDGYNYYLDATLWKDGVIVGTARDVANLNPTETLSADETTRETGFEASDFEGDGGKPTYRDGGETRTANDGGQPGFGVAAALLALCAALAITIRRKP